MVSGHWGGFDATGESLRPSAEPPQAQLGTASETQATQGSCKLSPDFLTCLGTWGDGSFTWDTQTQCPMAGLEQRVVKNLTWHRAVDRPLVCPAAGWVGPGRRGEFGQKQHPEPHQDLIDSAPHFLS